jgi:NAD(P)-dependent dehydrogenase (short-subunit alcohol dehydrogenase family)
MSEPPVALITAGTAGLGAATARLFARNGYRVVVNYNSNEDRAEELVAELTKLSPLVLPLRVNVAFPLKADLSKKENINSLVQRTIAMMGRLDIVFSNGGWTRLRDINDLDDNVDEEDWDRCFNMNVKSHLWLMHAAKPYLEKTEGVFITTASLAGVKVSGSSLVSGPFYSLDHLLTGVLGICCDQSRADTSCQGTGSHCKSEDKSEQCLSRVDVDGKSCPPRQGDQANVARNGD